ncbi:hypothetical protein ACO2Q8_08295 [Larkinella sp. VNQ87]|uniref:hypothetical protein n=1 Tax=Larkinella sp. VNQ87 TaxID=3400921 RepID=UPI003C0CB1BE
MTHYRFPHLALVSWTFRFWRAYAGPITGWMLLAALGRAVQMRIFGPVSSPVYTGLEVVVELARIITLLVIIGHGNLRRGAQKLVLLLRYKSSNWREVGQTIWTIGRQDWPILLWNLLAFSLLAFGFNKLNGLIADHEAVQALLRQNGLMHTSATGMPVFFFLKNLTVIPFTLIFEYGLFCWLAGKMMLSERRVKAGV